MLLCLMLLLVVAPQESPGPTQQDLRGHRLQLRARHEPGKRLRHHRWIHRNRIQGAVEARRQRTLRNEESLRVEQWRRHGEAIDNEAERERDVEGERVFLCFGGRAPSCWVGGGPRRPCRRPCRRRSVTADAGFVALECKKRELGCGKKMGPLSTNNASLAHRTSLPTQGNLKTLCIRPRRRSAAVLL